VRKLVVILLTGIVLSGCLGDKEYKVGDRGPAGGTIFYVASEPFLCGQDMDALCTYLEAAPAQAVQLLPWSEEAYMSENMKNGANGSAIGTGWQNTADILAQGNTDPTKSAAAYAAAYEFGGVSDWFLPSKDTLYEIYEQSTLLSAAMTVNYWSSTEADGNTSWNTSFVTGYQSRAMKFNLAGSWPVRAF